jgi:hypothetical protein
MRDAGHPANLIRDVGEAAEKAPAAAEFAEGEKEFVVARVEGKVDGVVFRVDDAEEAWVAKTLGAAATIENFAVEEDGDVVAVADFEFFEEVTVAEPGECRAYLFLCRA